MCTCDVNERVVDGVGLAVGPDAHRRPLRHALHVEDLWIGETKQDGQLAHGNTHSFKSIGGAAHISLEKASIGYGLVRALEEHRVQCHLHSRWQRDLQIFTHTAETSHIQPSHSTISFATCWLALTATQLLDGGCFPNHLQYSSFAGPKCAMDDK